ncbi:MAG TPA: 16S rRNA (cytosine(1402)-N(4))-methyltransferase RsmH [Gemmatimonadaceae bacterium]|nr:16S rRNA (cytosine(1402)-N(4))-methyltransferase RsmH [Gemmatimonadaceae bacterium]
MTSPQVNDSSSSNWYHTPVLVDEVLTLLRGAGHVLDATLGGGGHAQALLEHGVAVTALDRDPDALAAARTRLRAFELTGQFRPVLGNFASLDTLPAVAGQRYGGILLDLGVSSHQLDDLERGFSFREAAPLDMRMGRDALVTAAMLLNSSSERELAHIFRAYGDEPRSTRLAREVVRRRATRPFSTSDDLVAAIRGALGPRSGPPDFARLFQAVRIAVNGELGALSTALPALRDQLEPGGAMVVIAYHSGEDRLVKHAFREWSADCICPPRQPVCTCRGHPLGETLTRRPIEASQAERERNPRARSAKLRAWRAA